MKTVIVGLGNKEESYTYTRHNIGKLYVQKFASAYDAEPFQLKKSQCAQVADVLIHDRKATLVLPETAMNTSHKGVVAFVKNVKAARRLLVVRDDLDMPLGTIKMTFGRGSGGHKGVECIMRALKTKEFAQLKIGIAPTSKSGKTKKVSGEDAVVAHVLTQFSKKEWEMLEGVYAKAKRTIELFITDDEVAAMLYANTA